MFNTKWKVGIALVALTILVLAIVAFCSQTWHHTGERTYTGTQGFMLFDNTYTIDDPKFFYFGLNKGENVYIVLKVVSGEIDITFGYVDDDGHKRAYFSGDNKKEGNYEVSIQVDGQHFLIFQPSYPLRSATFHIEMTVY